MLTRRITARQRLAVFAAFVAWSAGAHARGGATMSDDAFWAIIEQTTLFEADTGEQSRALAQVLSAFTPDEIAAFQSALDRHVGAAYTWDLWGAGYVAHGGMSDDGFEYFRRWLVSKGRETYEHILARPDDLADVLAPDSEGPLEYEEFSYVAGEVWMSKTNLSINDFHNSIEPMTTPGEPSGEPFAEDADHLSRRYPKLWRRFSDNPLD